MRRRWYHYTAWESVDAGMYVPLDPTKERVEQAAEVLRRPETCRSAMLRVLELWPIASAQALSDTGRNRRAWLGRAAVCMETTLPESVTRVAWFTLDATEQARANEIADAAIASWEEHEKRSNGCQRYLWG